MKYSEAIAKMRESGCVRIANIHHKSIVGWPYKIPQNVWDGADEGRRYRVSFEIVDTYAHIDSNALPKSMYVMYLLEKRKRTGGTPHMIGLVKNQKCPYEVVIRP